MSTSETKIAIWTPGWYELDQTLSLGERQKYWFFQNPPDCADHPFDDDVELVFYNQLDSTTNCDVRYAEIVEMYHPQLGQLLKVDTDGLDYIFFPIDSEEIVVNAEEEPGTSCQVDIEIDNWSVLVKLADVSEPVAT